MQYMNQKQAMFQRTAVVALSVTLALSTVFSMPASAFPFKPDVNAQPSMSITMLRYDAGVLNIQAPVADVKPHWEIWDSKTDGQTSKMIIVDVPGLSAAHLPGFKQQLEIQAASMKLAHPEFLRLVVINTQPDTVRLMLEVNNPKESTLKPRLTVSSLPPTSIQPNVIPSLSNIRLYLSPPISVDPLTNQALSTTFVISPLEHEVQANIESPQPQQAAVIEEPSAVGPMPATQEPITKPTDPSSAPIVPPQNSLNPINKAIQQSQAITVNATVPSPPLNSIATVPSVSTVSTAAINYEQQVATLETALANVRKSLQSKEAALTGLKQQQNKSQQEITSLKQQLTQKQTELTQAKIMKPVVPVIAKPAVAPIVKPAPQNSAHASTTMFLELQKVAKEKESLKAQLEQSKLAVQSLKKESEALNAKLAAQPATSKAAEETYQLVAITQPVGNTPPKYEALDEAQVKKLEIEIQLHPDHWLAYSMLGRHYQSQGLWDDAERILKNLVLLDPQNTDGLAQLAMVYAYKGQMDQAQKTLAALFTQFDRISEIPNGLYPDIVEAQQRIILTQTSK